MIIVAVVSVAVVPISYCNIQAVSCHTFQQALYCINERQVKLRRRRRSDGVVWRNGAKHSDDFFVRVSRYAMQI